MKKKIISLVSFASILTPLFVFAQYGNCGNPDSTVFYMLCRVQGLLNTLMPLLVALGVVYFIWGVVSYVIAKEEEAKKAGRDKMIYGLIGLVVIVSVWGLVAILKKTFGVTSNQNTQIPCIPIPPNLTC